MKSNVVFTPMWSAPSTYDGERPLELEYHGSDHHGIQPDYDQDVPLSPDSDRDDHTGKHEYLLKSGPLGRCDDPFCTTCPPFYEYSRNLAGLHSPKERQSFFVELKTFLLDIAKWRPGIYNPHTKVVQNWNKFFAVCCLIAVFVDPLFFFIFTAKQGYFCLVFNRNVANTVTVIRTFFDLIYFLHMLLQFRLAYLAPASGTSRTGQLIDDPKTIRAHYLRGWFVSDLLAMLPIPQVLFWSVFREASGTANSAKDALRVVVIIQMVPRMCRILPLLFGRTGNGLIFEAAWSNFFINLFLYLLAGHVIGSIWYLLGLQRVNQCLQDTCKAERSLGCERDFLDCRDGHNINQLIANNARRLNWTSQSNSSESCFVQPAFPYGIYQIAVPVAMDNNPLHKYLYSIFWGFLQLSTLGGNLVPSLFIGEVLFTFFVIGLGLLLFALLIGNMQNFLQSLGRRKLEMQLKKKDMDAWMQKRNLSPEVQKRVHQAMRLKWSYTRGVKDEELLDRLPDDLQKEIRSFLCLELVKKVHIFTAMNDQVLYAICERLHEVFYIEGTEIFRMNAPLHRMVFIVRGTLISTGPDGHEHRLVSGDFCGEELLIWHLEHTVQTSIHTKSNLMKSIGNRALSTRTVSCSSSVEAFVLEEKDLEYITRYYTRHMSNPRVQGAIRYESPYFRSLAAARIQAAWKSYRRRKMDGERYTPSFLDFPARR